MGQYTWANAHGSVHMGQCAWISADGLVQMGQCRWVNAAAQPTAELPATAQLLLHVVQVPQPFPCMHARVWVICSIVIVDELLLAVLRGREFL